MPCRPSMNSDRLPMETVVSSNSHQFSSEEPLQELPVLLFWLLGYWAKTTKPLICLHIGSEPNYSPLLLLTHIGQTLNSVSSWAKPSRISGMWGVEGELQCSVGFGFVSSSLTNSCLQLPCTGQTDWLSLCKAAPLPDRFNLCFSGVPRMLL